MFGKGQLGECAEWRNCAQQLGGLQVKGERRAGNEPDWQAQGLRSVLSRKLSQEQMMGNQAS